jgi:4,5-dihydroxyphthalate decarboxylase
MANLKLSLAMAMNPRARPVLEGAVRADGIDLDVTVAHPGEIFYRQLHKAEFDVSEMSLSSLLIVTAKGNSPWVALPIFAVRRFFHTEILVRADAGIERPADLRGRPVGVPEYQQTAALWVRGALQHEWGLPPEALDWYMERAETHSHGGSTGFRPPPGVRFQRIPLDKSIASMLVDGELDATAFYVPERTVLDRSAVDLRGHPRVRTLFPDPLAEGIRYYQKTRLFPINHGMVVRRAILERHPWVALNLFRAFQTAQERALTQARQIVEPYFRLGVLPAAAQPALASDAYAYGVQANREVLETIARYSHEQGLTPRVVALEEVFAANTLDL